MSEDLGSASLRLEANPAPLMSGLATAKAKTISTMKGTSAASAAAFAAGMVAVGAAVGIGLYKIGEDYQTAFNTIRTETGATGEDFEDLKKSFKNVFGSTPADASEVATALSEVHKRTGKMGKPLEDLTLQFLRLSSATGTDVQSNIASVTRAFNDWGVEAKDQGETLDGFFGLSRKTGVGVSELATQLVQFGSPLRALGFDLDDAAAMFAAFEESGVNVNTMLPGLRMALKNIAQPSDDLLAKFRALGVDTKDPQEALATIMDTIKNMKNPTEAAGLAMEVFGTRAGTDMAQAIREGRFEVGDLVNVMKNSKGAIEENAAANATLSGRLQILKHRVMNLIEPIATKLVGALVDLAGTLLDLSDKFNSLPGPVKQAIGYAAMFSAGIVALALAFNKAKFAFLGIQALLAANPYLLLIGATVALAALIVTNWDEIKAYLEKTWKGIKRTAVGIWGGIREFFKKNWQNILLIFGGPMLKLVALVYKNWDTIRDTTSRIWNRIRELIKSPFEAAIGRIKGAATSVASFLAGKWAAIQEKVTTFWGTIRDRITSPVQRAKEIVTTTVTNLKTFLTNSWSSIVTSAKRLGTKLKNAIIGAFNGMLNEIKSTLEDIKDLPGSVIGGITSKFSASAAIPSSGSTTAGLSTPPTASTGGSSGSGAPQVNVTFADGMGWLKEFVNIQIDANGHRVEQTWIAGAGGIA